jgi:hypothetical protein
MKVDLYSVALIALLAIFLLVADRVLRINPLLAREGFQIYGQPQRCGTDLEPCPFPKRCMNGFCQKSDIPEMHDRNPLPVLP